jgi:hypothetical protein
LCEDCLDGSFRHCIRRRCVKGSYLKSALAALDACIWRGSRAYGAIDTIVCCSAYLKQKLDTDPLLRQKTVVLHNFSAVSPAASAEKGDYVLMFGHLSRQKGAYTLLEAAKRMPETVFVFAGTGEAAAEIRKLPNCRYAGFLTGDALHSLVARAKVTVYPSQWPENCPLSVIESISLGTPVIGSDMGGIPELIRPGRGKLGHGDEKGPCSVRAGQAFQRGLHHGPGPGGVDVHHVHIQPGQHRHGLLHGVGDVVELQVQEDPVSPVLDRPDDVRPRGVVQLHADLHEGLPPLEPVQKRQRLLRRGEVAGDDHVLAHISAHLL